MLEAMLEQEIENQPQAGQNEHASQIQQQGLPGRSWRDDWWVVTSDWRSMINR